MRLKNNLKKKKKKFFYSESNSIFDLSITQKQNKMQVAQTILQQLGGNKFVAMTGSKNFIASENFLRMNLTRNKAKAKWLKITLNANDTYTMDFFTADKNFNLTSKVKFEDVYCDQLCFLFTKATGLFTSL